jgi:hypothetical protein
MSAAANLESLAFKRVSQGYVYQVPNPWVFGPGRHYLVNETQKAELLAIITPRRPLLRIMVITGAIVAWVAIVAGSMFAFSGSGRDQPTALELLAMATLILVPTYIIFVVALHRQLRRIRPILADAPLSRERVTLNERWRSIGAATSSTKLALIAGLFGFSMISCLANLITRNGRHPLFSDPLSYVFTVVAVVFAANFVLYLWLLLRKLKERN